MNTHALPMLTLAVALGLTAAGCTRAHARAAADTPPLEVPLPPPRVVEVAEPDTLGPGTLVGEPALNTPRRRPPPAERADTGKPEAPPAEANPQGTPSPAAQEPRTSPPVLQTWPPEQEQNLEREVRTYLDQARTNLSKIDYNRLSAGARSQYNQARQFFDGAEAALAERNLPFARTQAERAATLAAQLARR